VTASTKEDADNVAVVVVTYNALPYLSRCLESVHGREVVVVDHGSTDGTVELVRERFPQVTLLRRENRGFAAGVNAGIETTHAAYVLLLNSDAWVTDGAVAALAAYADAHPEAGAVGPRLRYPDGSPQVAMRGFPTVWRLATQYLLLNKIAPRSRIFNAFYAGDRSRERVNIVDFIKGACLLLRRDVVEKVGLFDEQFFMFCEEADWCRRARDAGWTTVYVPTADVVHVGEATTRSVWSWERTFREQERSHLRFLAKHEGMRAAAAGRIVIGVGYLFRAVAGPSAKRSAYRRTSWWLFSTSLRRLLALEG
jgi:N-acetylglucosaminyl-diphospho-decaprenol L-rhamnosyltransferase